MRLTEKLEPGVAKALLGRTVLDDTLPYCTGSIGLLGTKPSWTLMNECDTFLMIGSSFPYSEFLPEPGSARGVQIDIDGRMLNIRYPMELGLVGDSQATLEELLPLLEPKTDRSWREQIEGEVSDWWKLIEDRAMQGDPKNPMTQNSPDGHYADFARMIGLDGIRIDSPDAIDAAWEEAFAADRPFVIDAVVDPEVPPLPPHITLEQARNFISALRGGDPHSRALITE